MATQPLLQAKFDFGVVNYQLCCLPICGEHYALHCNLRVLNIILEKMRICPPRKGREMPNLLVEPLIGVSNT